MVYRRSRKAFSSRRGGSRRRSTAWYNRKYSAKDVALQALRNTKYLKGLVNSEMFHHDRSETALNIGAAGAVANLCAIAQGDGASARTGNSLLLRNHLMRIRFTKDVDVPTTVIRFMLVQDNQQVGDTSPSVTDILTAADVDSPLNLNAAGRFKVLLNKTVQLHDNSPMYHKEMYRSLYTHLRYNGSASTDIQRNGYYLLTISDQSVATPTMDLYSRVGYRDN